MEKFQDVAKKVVDDNNLNSFAAHFNNNFTEKPITQQC